MDNKLPARPNLEHLRSQAKALLSQLNAGDANAAQTFIDHLPVAKNLTPIQVREAGFRLADAQSAIARKTGFATWPSLARHVEHLRQFEGEWEFVDLEVDGNAVPAGAIANSRMLMDGDRFRMESPEATYEGVFNIDVDQTPHQIDIEFVEGPEAGNWSYGIYEIDGDRFKICLGLTGAPRPPSFATSPGSGHALENLRRVSSDRPTGVKGGTPQTAPKPFAERADPEEFDVEMTPTLLSLEGDWSAVEVVRDGEALPKDWLNFGVRTAAGNEVKVVFGGQVMVHAKVRIDESTTSIAVDYLNLNGPINGLLSFGIMEWVGDEVRFCMAMPGKPRPTDFSCERGSGRTLSQWRRKE